MVSSYELRKRRQVRDLLSAARDALWAVKLHLLLDASKAVGLELHQRGRLDGDSWRRMDLGNDTRVIYVNDQGVMVDRATALDWAGKGWIKC